jgi:hypothetical protein
MERERGIFQVHAIYLTRVANITSMSHLLRAQREWESRPPKSTSAEIHLHGCVGIRFLGSVFATARVIRSTQRCFVYIRFIVVFPGRCVLLFLFRRPFERLHCVHLPTSTLYGYIEHTHEMSRVKGAIDALSIGPSAGYFMCFRIYACFIVVYCLCE